MRVCVGCASASCGGGDEFKEFVGWGKGEYDRTGNGSEGPVCCDEGSSPGLCHRVYEQSLKLRQKYQPGSPSRGF